jgi:small-conductance mechanosensitive channel
MEARIVLVTDVLNLVFLGNTLLRWAIAGGVFVVLLIGTLIARRGIVSRGRAFAARSPTVIDDALIDAVAATRLTTLTLPFIALSANVLALPPVVYGTLRMLATLSLLLQAGIWGNTLIGSSVERYTERNIESNAANVVNVNALSFIARLVLYSIIVLLALDNLPGIEVTALIASLGIGGIAVALAVQNILSDLFASLSITFDKPFVLGDFIIVGAEMGTVEHIGLKTTRLRSISGEQLIFSNTDLLNSRVRNFKRMEQRRVVFTVDVPYETPPEHLRRIPEILKAAVEAQANTRFDRAHFARFGSFALTFEVVYFMLSADFLPYMDAQQAINLTIVETFAAEGIAFAYPTQLVYLQGQPG